MKAKVFLSLFIVFTLNSVAQTKSFIDKAYLETTAEVDTLVMPNRIHMLITLEKDDKKAISELETKMVNAFKRIGIDMDKQFKIIPVKYSNYKKSFFKSKQKLQSFYYLLVYDSKDVWKVNNELQKLGIFNVSITKQEYPKKDEIQLQLKQKAIKKAVMKAKSMLAPLNRKLGKAIYITDVFKDYSKDDSDSDKFALTGKLICASYYPDLKLEKIKYSSKVLVKFEIQ